MEDFLRIAICEDTAAEADALVSILETSEVPNKCTVFHRAEDLLACYAPQMFDLLLMDIYMDGITGVEAVTKIRSVDMEVAVAFITSSKDFALESYRLYALDYVEKPFCRQNIERVLQMALIAREHVPHLTLRWEGREIRLPLSQILFLEIQNHRLQIWLKDNQALHVYEKLSDVLPQLEDHAFYQCHKSYCVNLSQVEYIDEELRCFVMTNGSNVPIRRNNMSAAKKVHADYLFRHARGIAQ